jgi:hypothetical protein
MMKKQSAWKAFFCLQLFLVLNGCKKELSPWEQFAACSNPSCVAEAIAVKTAFLQDPKPIFEAFIQSDSMGSDTYIGWIYLLRDSVVNNPNYDTEAARQTMKQALIDKAKEFENDPKYGTWSQSIIRELTGESDDVTADGYEPITGTYVFELPNEAGSGEIKILENEDQTVRFALMVVAGPPAYNQGYMEGTAPLTDNVVTISTEEYGGKCTITLSFSNDEIIAKTVAGDASACGFGNNVMADGTYQRVDDLNPFRAAGGDETPAQIQGHWVSTEDPKSEVIIAEGKYIEIYNGSELSNSLSSYHKICPKDCNPIAETPCLKVTGQDDICYTVVKADGKTMELSMIGGRGNTLVFKKKGLK